MGVSSAQHHLRTGRGPFQWRKKATAKLAAETSTILPIQRRLNYLRRALALASSPSPPVTWNGGPREHARVRGYATSPLA
jgi:hypothetical protein